MEIKSLGMSTSSFKRTSTLCKLCYVGLSPTWRCCYHNVCGTPIHTGVFVFIFETFSLIMENFTLFWPSSWHGFHCTTSIRLRQIPGKKKIVKSMYAKSVYTISNTISIYHPICVVPKAVLRSSVRSHAAHAIGELKKMFHLHIY